MVFSELMKEVKSMFDNWLNDKTFSEYYQGNKIELQKDFIQCIQGEIGSDFVIITKEEFDKKLMEFHNSMEGTY
jgi:queuine/archaeosine tRNA-ribosyltransferase